MGNRVVVLLTTFIVMLFASYGVVGSIFVLYVKDMYGLRDVTPITLALTISSIVSIVAMFFTGYLYDRYGLSPLLALAATAMVVWVICVNAMGSYTTWDKASVFWYLAGVPQGVALVSTMMSINPTLMMLFPRRRGLAVSVSQAAQAFALAFWSYVATHLIKSTGFFKALTVIGVANAILISIAMAIFRKTVKFDRKTSNESPKTSSSQHTIRASINKALLWSVYAMVFLIALSSMILMNLLAGVLEEPFSVYMGMDAEYVRSTIVPRIMSITGVVQAIAAFFWGYLIDKLGPLKAIPVIYGSETLTTVIAFSLYRDYPWIAISFISLRYVFFSAEPTVHWVLIPEIFGIENLGKISGIINSAPMVSSTVSPILSGLVRDITKSHRFILLSSFMLSIFAIMIYLWMKQILISKRR